MLKENESDRRTFRLSPGSAPFHRQTDRFVAELRGAGGHRYRERAAAQRTARETEEVEAQSQEL